MTSWQDVPTRTIEDIEAEQSAKLAGLQSVLEGARFTGRFGCVKPAKPKNKAYARNCKPIECVENPSERYESVKAGARTIGAGVTSLKRALKHGWKAKGRHWRYASPTQGAASPLEGKVS